MVLFPLSSRDFSGWNCCVSWTSSLAMISHDIFFQLPFFTYLKYTKNLYPSIWIITELAVKWKIAYKYDHFVNFHTLYSIRTIVICFKYPFSSYSILYFIYIYAEKTKNHFYLERPASRLKYFCVALAVASQPAPAGVESAPNGSFTDYVTEEGPVKKTL